MRKTRTASVLLVGVALTAACTNDEEALPGDLAVDAGAIQLRIVPSPWQMLFFDEEGEPVLSEHSGTADGPTGSLAVHLGGPPPSDGSQDRLPPLEQGQPSTPPERDSGWVHATELLSSSLEAGVYTATMATTDPAHTIELSARSTGDGLIEIEATATPSENVQAVGVGFVATENERFVGFGERGNAVDQWGWDVEHFVAEGPYQDNEYAFIEILVPPPGLRWRPDATYFPIPWLLSSRGYGVLIENDEVSYHRMGTDGADAWSMEVESRALRFTVHGGPTPAQALSRFTTKLGTQPSESFAPWFLGPWLQTDQDSRIDEMRAADTPTSVTATFLHYLPCGRQQGREQEQVERTAALNAKGTAVHTYFNPMICVDYEPVFSDAESQGALLVDQEGKTYTYEYSTSETFFVSQFDFTAPNGVSAYKALTDEALRHGYEGWMEDFGEYTPLDAVDHDGVTGSAYHNRYARDYHCGAHAATKDAGIPLARFARSGWTGSAACTPIVWGGDPTVGFGFDGLESSIYQALSMGTSGVGLWGSDIGGFFALFGNSLSDEMLDRWVAFGALSVVMRSQKDGIAVPDTGRPQPWDESHLPVWRRYAKLHTQLYPYLRAALAQYYSGGLPVMRHHVLTNPNDPIATARDDQYMFGPDLLVAPVYQEGASERELYLPSGTWIEWWRSVEYQEAEGSFRVTTPTLHDGNSLVTVAAPLEEIPLFARAGAVIALLAPDVWTLAEHGDDPSIVHASDRDDQLHVLAFPRGRSSGAMYETGTWISEERSGSWAVTLDVGDSVAREIHLQASLAALREPFEPCSVILGDVPLDSDGWSYDSTHGVLRVDYETDGGTLVVSGC